MLMSSNLRTLYCVALLCAFFLAVPYASAQSKEPPSPPVFGSTKTLANRQTLAQSKFHPLPLGSILPSGWLREQLELQSHGLTGHLDEFWPDLKNSSWIGGTGESWERGPYFFDGLIPLAFLLKDPHLI